MKHVLNQLLSVRRLAELAVVALVATLVHVVGPTAIVPAAAQSAPISVQWQPLGEPGSGGRMDALAVSPYDPNHVLLAGDILGTGVSFAGGRSWQPTIGWDSWEHSDFTFLPDQAGPSEQMDIWAATLSGPHFSSDGGRTWTPRLSGLPTGSFYPAAVEKILVDPDTSTTLYAFGGELITDGATIDADLVAGRSLTLSATGPTGPRIRSVRFDLDDGSVTNVDNSSPFSLFGDQRGDYSSGPGLEAGTHQLVVQYFDKRSARGALLATDRYTFTIGG